MPICNMYNAYEFSKVRALVHLQHKGIYSVVHARQKFSTGSALEHLQYKGNLESTF
jgi:hypothetical protein